MPKVKRTVSETAILDRPADEENKSELHIQAEQDLWDHIAELTDKDWQNRSFYVWQIEPPITKKEGEPAYVVQWSERFTPDMIQARAPEGKRFKIMEKVTGRRERPIWFIAMVPRSPAQPSSSAQSYAGNGNPDLRQLASDMTKALSSSPQLLEEASRKGLAIVGDAYATALSTAGKPANIVEGLIQLQTAGIIPRSEPFNWKEMRELIKEILPAVKEITGAGSKAKSGIEEIRELVSFMDELGVLGRGNVSIWAELAPKLAETAKDISGNIAQIVNARRPFVQQPPQPNPTVTRVNEGSTATTSAAPAAAAPSPQVSPADAMRDLQAKIEMWLKLRFVELYSEKDEKGEHFNDAETLGSWIQLTIPQLAALLEVAPMDKAMEFFKADPILAQIATDENGVKYLEEVIKAIKGK
jgi:hypothetical protein